MEQQKANEDLSLSDSVVIKSKTIFDYLYKKYKGEKYKEKVELAEKSLRELTEFLSKDEQALQHLKNIEDCLDYLIKNNKKLTIKELAFDLLHIVMLYNHFKN